MPTAPRPSRTRSSTAPSGMTIDPASGLLLWTPPVGPNTSVEVEIQVTDSAGLDTTQDFQLPVVTPVADVPPVISTTQTPAAAQVDSLFSYQVQATSPVGSPLSYTLTTTPAGMTISSTGLITWTPSTVGTDPVVVQVSDMRSAAR